MAFRPNLVNKQFNSPIKLYSPENVAETLEKQKQILANGAVGIDFHNLAKPGNLANSAVLRMLEEEEANRARTTGLKRVAWPPPPEESDQLQDNNETSQSVQYQQPVYSQGPQPVASPVKLPSSPGQFTSGRRQAPDEPFSTQTFVNAPSPHFQEPYHSPPPPLAPSSAHFQPPSPAPAPAPAPYYPVHFEPPKTTVQLLPSAPVRQKPPPIYASQPVTATVKGGARMRGDQKWPPESVKQQTAAENEARVALAKGPACRPRKIKKDYSSFFAQHALTATYPGYRAPPGTQHYMEGASNL